MADQPRPANLSRISRFESYYKGLDAPIKETVDLVIAGIEADWGNPWFRARKMTGYKDKWLFDVNGQYRIVANKTDSKDFSLEFVGTKNQVKKKY